MCLPNFEDTKREMSFNLALKRKKEARGLELIAASCLTGDDASAGTGDGDGE